MNIKDDWQKAESVLEQGRFVAPPGVMDGMWPEHG
jgi:hypothetical protein